MTEIVIGAAQKLTNMGHGTAGNIRRRSSRIGVALDEDRSILLQK